jgi:HSP20 family protein
MYGEDERFPTRRRRRGYYPTYYEDRSADDWFRGGLGNMVRMFGPDLPKGFERLTRIVEGPTGDVRERVGPYVYGFSYTAEPGKEPIFQEFGNISPADQDMERPEGRIPLVMVSDKGDHYEVSIEMPGVEKEKINLDFYENSFHVETEGEPKFHGRTLLAYPVDPNTAKASYMNGVLKIEVEKQEDWKPSKLLGAKVAVE